MIIHKKSGSLNEFTIGDRIIEHLPLEWYETNKRILHKRTNRGKEITMKFLNESQQLQQDDVVYEDNDCLVVIDIEPCDTIIVHPESMHQMAVLCYEIGNRHIPLFFENNELLVPFEAPLFRFFSAAGFDPIKEKRKLLHPLKTTVSAHNHESNTSSLFSKILQLTSPPSNV